MGETTKDWAGLADPQKHQCPECRTSFVASVGNAVCPFCHCVISSASDARHALGLPAGSVRALLTLLIVAVVAVRLVRNLDLGLWRETLMITIAHYFTSRSIVRVPEHLRRRLETEGAVEQESTPLYLPRHSIRMIILMTFIALAVYFFVQGQLFVADNVSVLGVVLAYFVGMLARLGVPENVAWWDDLKAAVVLVLAFGAATAAVFNLALPFVPGWAENVILGIVLFYFGSR